MRVITNPLRFAILVYPGSAPLDVLGTHTALDSTSEVELHLVWKDLEPFEHVPRWPMRATKRRATATNTGDTSTLVTRQPNASVR
ncbi:hypothetical protein J4558_27305 [Leptolyngbya sp. 15MV]|nr:hypothetical protein J4558_27305 [Leptolyngbya sp. 15MV]